MQIIILAAGAGQRFVDNGFDVPKPLIKVKEKTLLHHSYESLKLEGNYFFVCQKKHENNFQISKEIKSFCNDAKIVFIDGLTRGPAESALHCKFVIDEEKPLITINCDQKMVWNEKSFLNFLESKKPDGCVVTVKTNGKNYSYALVNELGEISKIAEKEVISDYGLIGLHYYKKAKYFFDSAENMIQTNRKQKNEFYISDTYNILIEKKLKILNYSLTPEETQIVLGTPSEIQTFESSI